MAERQLKKRERENEEDTFTLSRIARMKILGTPENQN